MGQRRKYDWNRWADDGAQWILWKNEDFTISVHNFQISAHGWARANGRKVSTRTFTERFRDDQGLLQQREGIILQFWTEE